MKVWIRIPAVLLAVAAVSSCGGAKPQADEAAASAAATAEGGLTAFELEHGIGPVTTPVQLGEPDRALGEQGEELFKLKCMACHRTDERYIGPAIGDVLDRRSPAYVMNMMLNPTEMTQRHPDAKALLAEYLAPMPSQDLSEADARALLEYLRLSNGGDPDDHADDDRDDH